MDRILLDRLIEQASESADEALSPFEELFAVNNRLPFDTLVA